jgi:hypothetical protein
MSLHEGPLLKSIRIAYEIRQPLLQPLTVKEGLEFLYAVFELTVFGKKGETTRGIVLF